MKKNINILVNPIMLWYALHIVYLAGCVFVNTVSILMIDIDYELYYDERVRETYRTLYKTTLVFAIVAAIVTCVLNFATQEEIKIIIGWGVVTLLLTVLTIISFIRFKMI